VARWRWTGEQTSDGVGRTTHPQDRIDNLPLREARIGEAYGNAARSGEAHGARLRIDVNIRRVKTEDSDVDESVRYQRDLVGRMAYIDGWETTAKTFELGFNCPKLGRKRETCACQCGSKPDNCIREEKTRKYGNYVR
jgi:hypothetical protein